MSGSKDFWRNKRVLVTGHTGFKGSWLSIWLDLMGAEVIGYSLDPYTERDNFVLSALSERIVDIRGNICDGDRLFKVFDEYKPEIVFHLAAQPLVRLSYEEPVLTYQVNVMGTMNVLECIRKTSSVKTGIMITTDKCYENKEQIWGYRETDPFGGYDPYSSSKGCAEILIASYRNSYFNPREYEKHGKMIASVRAGNVIGGGDWSRDRIVPDCIRALEMGEGVKIRNPHATRPFQHVLEPLSGYLLLAQKLDREPVKYGEGWNFGPEPSSVTSVWSVAKKIVELYGRGTLVDASEPGAVHEANLLSLDITKARQKLGWSPCWDIEQTLEKTVEWYKKYKEEDMYRLCTEQIEAYMSCKNIEKEL